MTPTDSHSDHRAAATHDAPLLIIYYLTLALLMSASYLTELRLWGIDWWGYFPLWVRLVVFAAAAALPWPVRGRLRADRTEEGSGKGWAVWSLVVPAASLALFMVLRTRMHLLGDGFQLMSRLATQAPPIRPWNPAVYFLQDNIYALLGGGGQDDALVAFRLISWTAGLLFMGGLLWAARRLFGSNIERLLFVVAAATGGFALLFFGYVENYPMLVGLISLFLILGWLSIAGYVGQWWVMLPLVVAGLFHPFTAAMLPALVYLLSRDSAAVNWYDRQSGGIRMALWAVIALGTAAFFYYMQSGITFLRFSLVPWFADQFTVEGYTLLSGQHLLDFVNLLFLFAPPLLLYLYAQRHRTRLSETDRQAGRFLVLAVLPALVIAFFFDPKLGMARDWDIFAFAAAPLTLWGLFKLTRLDRPVRLIAMFLAGLLGLMILAPRLAIDASEPRAIAWFQDIARLDQTKNRRGLFVLISYYRETGRDSEADRLQKKLLAVYPQDPLSNRGDSLFARGKLDEAEAAYREIIRLDPTYSSAWGNLGMVAATRGLLDSAEAMLHIADALNPYDPNVYDRLGNVYIAQRRYDKAEEILKKSRALKKESFSSVKSLMMLYRLQDRRTDYDSLLCEAAIQTGAPPILIFEYADFLAASGRINEAVAQYRRALAAGLDPSAVRQAEAKYPGLRVLP